MTKQINISIPFLATQRKQIVSGIGNSCVEATIFNREDLENETWRKVWENIEIAAESIMPHKVTFHFPVNKSDYVSDSFVKARLIEAFQRASDMGLHGVVVHSNRIRSLNEWDGINLQEERCLVIDTLLTIRSQINSQTTWLALENMPVMDNHCIEIDPLFCYPKDFSGLLGKDVGIVWDICHFTNTIATIEQVSQGRQDKKYYPNIQICHPKSFLDIKDQIVHWHFSAFKGIPNPYTNEPCSEGALPWEATLGEDIYKKLWKAIQHNYSNNQHVVLEISEDNYEERTRVPQMLKWVNLLG